MFCLCFCLWLCVWDTCWLCRSTFPTSVSVRGVVIPCSLFPLTSTAFSYVLGLVLQVVGVVVWWCSCVCVCFCVCLLSPSSYVSSHVLRTGALHVVVCFVLLFVLLCMCILFMCIGFRVCCCVIVFLCVSVYICLFVYLGFWCLCWGACVCVCVCVCV